MKSAVTEPIPEEGRRKAHEDTECNNNATRCQNYLELRLGMSLVNGLEVEDGKGDICEGGACPRYLTTQDGLVMHQRNGTGLGGGAKRGFSETTGSFVHPWSLAARQEKATLEQARRKTTYSSIVTRVVHPPQPVGWPPVHSFRRNLGVQNQSKSMMNSEPKVEIKFAEKESMHNELQERPTMFVKVNIEGCTLGRKIDLKLHNGYDLLSHALQKMFHNFLCVNYLDDPKQDEPDALTSPSYILLYEDNEGDRMLVGDVPWELFISSVKRLYITLDPRSHKCGLT